MKYLVYIFALLLTLGSCSKEPLECFTFTEQVTSYAYLGDSLVRSTVICAQEWTECGITRSEALAYIKIVEDKDTLDNYIVGGCAVPYDVYLITSCTIK